MEHGAHGTWDGKRSSERSWPGLQNTERLGVSGLVEAVQDPGPLSAGTGRAGVGRERGAGRDARVSERCSRRGERRSGCARKGRRGTEYHLLLRSAPPRCGTHTPNKRSNGALRGRSEVPDTTPVSLLAFPLPFAAMLGDKRRNRRKRPPTLAALVDLVRGSVPCRQAQQDRDRCVSVHYAVGRVAMANRRVRMCVYVRNTAS